MAVITINGQRGSGAREIGAEVARQLQYDYVDRLILSEAARHLGATVEAVEDKWQRSPGLGGRLSRFLERLMERSATAGAGGDPYFGPGLGVLLGQDYPDAVTEPISNADQLEDEHFLEATQNVIVNLADSGNVVIIGRASNHILKERSDALHVGMVSTLESRVEVVAKREGLSTDEARRFTIETEKARVEYFRKFFKASADEPADYHLMLSTHMVDQRTATDIIIRANESRS